MWDAQGKRNLLQEGIDKSQNDAIRSLARPQIGDSIIDYIDLTDEEIKKGVTQPTVPTWAANMTYINPSSNESWLSTAPYPNSVYRSSKRTEPVRDYAKGGIAHPVNPDTEYRWSIWIKNIYNDASFYITLCDENGNADIIESGSNSSGNPKKMAIISNLGDKNDWTKYSGTFRFKRGTRFARVKSIDSNYSSKNYGWLWYCKLIVEPNMPSQEEVDAAQTKAIKANTLALKNQKAINNKQDGIAAAHTKAIDSNRKAIRALAKIDLGGSLLAYMPLTDEEIKKGLTREYLPAWAANATNVLDGSKLSGTTSSKGYVFLSGQGGSAKGEEVYAQVSQGTQYLLDIDLFTPTYMMFNITFKTSNSKIRNPIKNFYWTDVDEYGGLKTTSRLSNTDSVNISTRGGREKIIVEFQDNVEDIYVQKLSWTRTNSVTVKSFSLAPYTPSQAAIDARQNKALKGLELAQKLQTQMTEKNSEFAKEIYKASTGIIHLRREESAGSSTHGVGFVMPYRNTIFSIYARTNFHGNLIILVDYATGLGDGLRVYRLDSSSLHLALNPNNNVSSSTVKNELFKGEDHYKYYNLNIAGGDVENIIVFVDHLDWNRH